MLHAITYRPKTSISTLPTTPTLLDPVLAASPAFFPNGLDVPVGEVAPVVAVVPKPGIGVTAAGPVVAGVPADVPKLGRTAVVVVPLGIPPTAVAPELEAEPIGMPASAHACSNALRDCWASEAVPESAL